jgi:membrane associated rhomboid family serine protease
MGTDTASNPRPYGAIVIAASTAACSIAFWILEALAPDESEELRRFLWNSPSLVVLDGWVWQLVTANFLHRDLVPLGV